MSMEVRVAGKIVGYIEYMPDLLNNTVKIDDTCYRITSVNSVDDYVGAEPVVVIQGDSLPRKYDVCINDNLAGFVRQEDVSSTDLYTIYNRVYEVESINHRTGKIRLKEVHAIAVEMEG